MRVYCKKTYKVNEDLHVHLNKEMKNRFTFHKGNYYQIFSENETGYGIWLSRETVIGFYKAEYAENNTNIFENFFYTENEYRKLKLKKIENEKN